MVNVLTVTVLDCNDRPSAIFFNSSLSVHDNTSYKVVIPENSPSGTSLTNLSVVDEDVGQKHKCTLREGGSYFNINSVSKSSSEIRVKRDAILNYESHLASPITVSVECQGNGSPPYSVQRNFIVQLSDVNEAPFDISLNSSTVVEENVHVGYVIGYLTCNDSDIGQSHVFTVTGNYSSVFQATSSNYLIVKDPSFLNYEVLYPFTELTVTIRATDQPANGTGPPLDVISDFKINVTDVNEAPDDIRLIPENVTVPENVSIGYCLAQVTSRNPEQWQTVAYTALNYRDLFSIEDKCKDNSSSVSQGDSNLPYLTVKSHLSYDDYIIRGYQILIKAEDNGIPPRAFNGTVKVHVTKVDPCPWSTCHVDATCSRVNWQNYTCACNDGFSGDGASTALK
ncbi:hypothetical protein OS493_011059 [Desmophyllum pertusum]|uniref:Uncharacterized protein n=1 Tax=Desmophyllum pertusum TaxID=174260 RepID=A0A9X0CYL9_9CNID|nr:hypothetical protein OS493_011059 [Desmophyllum pertusum]